MRHGRRAGRASRPVIVTALTIAVVILVSFGVLRWADQRRPQPIASQSVPTAPFAGNVPWGSATLDSDGVTLHLLADWDGIQANVCNAPPSEVLVVQQDTDDIVITVRGFAELPPNGFCAGVGHGTQPHTIRLAAPLGDRALIDGSENTPRTVLTDSEVPTVYDLPAGYIAAPTFWADAGINDMTTQGVTRTWHLNSPKSGTTLILQVILTAPLPTADQEFDRPDDVPLGPAIGQKPVNGQSATQYQRNYGNDIETTIRWTAASGEQFNLAAAGRASDALNLAQLETIAQSVR